MKHLFFVLTMLCLVGCASDRTTGPTSSSFPDFMGIRLGDSPETATAKMLAIEGVMFVRDSAGLRFTGGTFMGHEVEEWTLDFWQGTRFWYADVTPVQDIESAPEILSDLGKKLEDQYGTTPEPLIWRFPMEGEEKTNVVSLWYHPGTRIQVWYGGHAYGDSLNRTLIE